MGPTDKPENIEHTIAVRKIDNGYVVRHSIYDGDGYSSTETFSKEAPKIEPPKPARAVYGSKTSSLTKAIGHLK